MPSPPSVSPNHQHSKSSCSIGSDPTNNGSNSLKVPVCFCRNVSIALSRGSPKVSKIFGGSQGSAKCELPGGPTAGNRLLGGARPLCHRRWPSQAPDTSDGRKWHSPALPRRTPGRDDSLGRGGADRTPPQRCGTVWANLHSTRGGTLLNERRKRLGRDIRAAQGAAFAGGPTL